MTGTKTETSTPHIVSKSSPCPADLPSLGAVFREAEAAGLDVVMVMATDSKDRARAAAKKRHDLKAALRTVQLCVKALQGGYRFDDQDAQAKIDAMARAAAVLAQDLAWFDQLLAAD